MGRALLVRDVPGWHLYGLLYELDPGVEWEGIIYRRVVVSPIRGSLVSEHSSSVVDVYAVPDGVDDPTPDNCVIMEVEKWGTDRPEDGLGLMGYEIVLPAWPDSLAFTRGIGRRKATMRSGSIWPGPMLAPRHADEAYGGKRLYDLMAGYRMHGMLMSDCYDAVVRVQREDLVRDVCEGGYVTSVGFMLHGQWLQGLTGEEIHDRLVGVERAILKRTRQLTRDFYEVFGKEFIKADHRAFCEEDPLSEDSP